MWRIGNKEKCFLRKISPSRADHLFSPPPGKGRENGSLANETQKKREGSRKSVWRDVDVDLFYIVDAQILMVFGM